MHPHEVRRGNIVEYDGATYKIDMIAEEFPCLDTIDFGVGVVDWNNINPVPLTEDWLRKLGFDDKEYKDGFIGIDVRHTDFVLTKPNIKCESMTSKYYTFHCSYGGWPRFKSFKYLHDLQNFFYALYQEDLTEKITT